MNTALNNNMAQAIYLATKDKTQAEQSLFFKKVVQFLSRKRLLQESKDILLRLEKIINKEEERVVAKVLSKNILSVETKKEIIKSLTKRYSAKEVILLENLDTKLLGGFKIEVNNEVIDLTIKNKISKLQEYLIKSI